MDIFLFSSGDKNNSRAGGPSPQGSRPPNTSIGNPLMDQSVNQQQSVSSIGGGFPPSSPNIVSSAANNSGSGGNMNFTSPNQMQNAGPVSNNNNSNFMDMSSSSPSHNISEKPDVIHILFDS